VASRGLRLAHFFELRGYLTEIAFSAKISCIMGGGSSKDTSGNAAPANSTVVRVEPRSAGAPAKQFNSIPKDADDGGENKGALKRLYPEHEVR